MGEMSPRARTVTTLLACLAGLACAGEIVGPGGDGGSADGGADRFDDEAAPLFDEQVIRRYALTVAPADWDRLNATATDEVYVPAELALEGETFPMASVRYKGSYGTLYACFDGAGNRTCQKLSLKVSFNERDPEGSFHGLRKLNFHSLERDPSKVRDALGYRLFRRFGVPASRTAFARLSVNGEDLGLFLLVENVDGRFTRARYPDGGEGNLYDAVWPVHEDAPTYQEGLKTNEDLRDVGRMLRFARELGGATDDPGFRDVLARWQLDDQLARYMALARLLDHWDDVTAFYCGGGNCGNHNFYWYESRVEDRMWLVPWDLDNTLDDNPLRTFGYPDWDDAGVSCELIDRGDGNFMRAPSCDPILGRLATAGRDAYVEHTEALLAGEFAPGPLDARIAEIAAVIEAEVATDPNGPSTEAWRAAVEEVRTRIGEKRAFIRTRLPPAP